MKNIIKKYKLLSKIFIITTMYQVTAIYMMKASNKKSKMSLSNGSDGVEGYTSSDGPAGKISVIPSDKPIRSGLKKSGKYSAQNNTTQNEIIPSTPTEQKNVTIDAGASHQNNTVGYSADTAYNTTWKGNIIDQGKDTREDLINSYRSRNSNEIQEYTRKNPQYTKDEYGQSIEDEPKYISTIVPANHKVQRMLQKGYEAKVKTLDPNTAPKSYKNGTEMASYQDLAVASQLKDLKQQYNKAVSDAINKINTISDPQQKEYLTKALDQIKESYKNKISTIMEERQQYLNQLTQTHNDYLRDKQTPIKEQLKLQPVNTDAFFKANLEQSEGFISSLIRKIKNIFRSEKIYSPAETQERDDAKNYEETTTIIKNKIKKATGRKDTEDYASERPMRFGVEE